MSRPMAVITCHLSWPGRSPNSALTLITAALSLKSPWNRSLLLLSRIRRRLILLPLSTSTHVLDAPCVIYISFNGQGGPDHRVPSSHVCWRMMCLQPLEVTSPSLAHRCTSPYNGSCHDARLHNDGNCSAYGLYKGLWGQTRMVVDYFLVDDLYVRSLVLPSTQVKITIKLSNFYFSLTSSAHANH